MKTSFGGYLLVLPAQDVEMHLVEWHLSTEGKKHPLWQTRNRYHIFHGNVSDTEGPCQQSLWHMKRLAEFCDPWWLIWKTSDVLYDRMRTCLLSKFDAKCFSASSTDHSSWVFFYSPCFAESSIVLSLLWVARLPPRQSTRCLSGLFLAGRKFCTWQTPWSNMISSSMVSTPEGLAPKSWLICS